MSLSSTKFAAAFAMFCIFVFASSEGLNESRKPRIFTFNADSEDIEVGLDFSIPFLKIPFKKTFNAVAQFGFPGISLPNINLNPLALLLGGFMIITTSIFAPLLNKAVGWHHLERSSRSDTENESKHASLYITEKLLANSGGCPERIACWSSQTKNPETVKTWKQIMSNKLLSTILNTTALEVATAQGRAGQNCERYSPCPITERTLPRIIHSFATLTNTKFASS